MVGLCVVLDLFDYLLKLVCLLRLDWSLFV